MKASSLFQGERPIAIIPSKYVLIVSFVLIFDLVSYFSLAQQPRLVLPVGHLNQVNSASFSPDGTKIITVSEDLTAKLWDAQTGILLADMRGHTTGIRTGSFSPDGQKIVTCSWDKTAIIWDTQSGASLLVLKGHTNGVNSAYFSPDSKKVVTASGDNTAKIWDAQTGLCLVTLTGHSVNVKSAQFSADGKKIVTASFDSTAKIWDVQTGLLLRNLKGHKRLLMTAFFAPDDKTVVTSSSDSTAKIWDAESGSILHDLKNQDGDVSGAFFSPDGKTIVTTSDDGTNKIWDAQSGHLLIDMQGYKHQTLMASFSPDGTKMVTAAIDHTAKVWNVQNGKLLIDIKGHTNEVLTAFFSPDGKKIITSSADFTAKIWDAQTGRIIHDLTGHTSVLNDASFSPDNKKIATASMDKTAKIWDVQTGTLLATLRGHTSLVNSACFSPDQSKIVTASFDGTAGIWDLQNASLLHELHSNSACVSAYFSPDGKRIVTACNYGTAKVWDVHSGKLLTELQVNPQQSNNPLNVFCAAFSPDGSKIVTSSFDGAKIWDVQTNMVLKRLSGHKGYVLSACFSPDGKKIATTSNDGTAIIWDSQSGNEMAKLIGHKGWVNCASFSPDGKKIVTSSNDGTAKIWDVQSGTVLEMLKGHLYWVLSAAFSGNGKEIVTSSADNTCKVWDAKSGALKYTFFPLDSTDYLYQMTSGYYKCTKSAARLLHYVTDNTEVITFEQLDIRYNRPDKVLRAIGNPDTALIRAYQHAYEKRIEKSGIDTNSFSNDYSVPKADFVNRQSISYEQSQGRLSVHIKGVDIIHTLDRFNIWVNQVPVYGINGISLKKRNSGRLDTTIAVMLSRGENRIETSVINSNGAESYHMPLNVRYTSASPDSGKLYFVGIGINKFAGGQHELRWSVNDIRALASRFKCKYGSHCEIDTLFDQGVIAGKVKLLKNKLLHTGVNDKVLIAFSGHGLFSKSYDYYLSSYDMNFDKPEQKGIPYDALEHLLDSIPARKKLMLIDACNSGEVDKEELAHFQRIKADPANRELKGLETLADTSRRMGLKSSFTLMQELFVNESKNTGATIISASGGTQFAREEKGNGIFTRSLLEYLKRPHCSISGLKAYVNRRVVELSAGLQVPTTRTETDAVDWFLW